MTRINGRGGNAGFVIDGVEYKCALSEHEFESNVPQLSATTFCNEAAPVFEPDLEVGQLRAAGFLTKGDPASGPLYPLPQGAVVSQKFDALCTISGTVNFTRGLARRIAGANAVIAFEGLYTGVIAKAWPLS